MSQPLWMLPKAKKEPGLVKAKVAHCPGNRRNWQEGCVLVAPPSRWQFLEFRRRRPETGTPVKTHGILSARPNATPPHTDHFAAQMADDRTAGRASRLARHCGSRRHAGSHA